MRTALTLPLRCLSGVPLLKEDGTPAEIVPFDDFKNDLNGERKFNLVDKTSYYNIEGKYCEWLSINVFQVDCSFGEKVILTVDWKENE